MTEVELKARTKKLALDVIELIRQIERGLVSDVLVRQLIRCATAVGANYRAACRARTDAEMAAKLGIVEEEADEVLYWIELLVESQTLSDSSVAATRTEAEEILRIVVASIKTIRSRIPNRAVVREETAAYDDFLPESDLPNPQSAIDNPKSLSPNPQSPIHNPQ